ncbi:polysaccharide deacetylase family protein [Methylovulum psychrotolerans]|uniref:polysaccharide deacetylase family protein n=1 Tax=Methylovulum psychrotolerans TaxID=1704499 RepID=UPI001BFEED75|nr:polysaccharide deacetylase family protein [Methylovulum psychrotolerans]MBT9096170.1 polysaccharide deacetylase family protein [Methylovulum psychrotolerans]
MKHLHGLFTDAASVARLTACGLSLLGLPAISHATADAPEAVFMAFYQHIARHDCAAAVALAEGYTLADCQNVQSLTPPPMPNNIMVSRNNRITFQTQLDYTNKNPAATYSCDYAVTVQRRQQWRVIMPAKALKACLPSSSAPLPLTPAEQLPAVPPQPDKTADQAKPAAPPPPALPAAQAKPTNSLLGLWPAEVLRGKPGEERITHLAKPNVDPPDYLEAPTKLPALAEAWQHSIRRVRLPADKPLVALTFDLCEQADDVTGYDRDIVNYLRDQQIPATFFAGGKWMRSHPDKTQQLMADPNFEIGNHGWTHGNLRVLGGQKMRNQITWTQAEYAIQRDNLNAKAQQAGLAAQMQHIPHQPMTLRFPYGTCNKASLEAVNGLGLAAIQWDVVSGDAAPRIAPTALANGVIRQARSGSIIVFHANGRGHGTAAALPKIVSALQAKGLHFVTVSQLLQAGSVETVQDCYEMRPGDNHYIDAKFGEGTQ